MFFKINILIQILKMYINTTDILNYVLSFNFAFKFSILQKHIPNLINVYYRLGSFQATKTNVWRFLL